MKFNKTIVKGNETTYNVVNMLIPQTAEIGTVRLVVNSSNKQIKLYNNSPFYSNKRLAYEIYNNLEQLNATTEYYIVAIEEDGLDLSYYNYETITKLYNKEMR